MNFLLKHNKKYDIIFLILSIIIAFLYFLNIDFLYSKTNIIEKTSDIVFVLDVSKSMQVLDYSSESRLEIAKKTIKDYIKNNQNNRYGLVIFAGEAVSILPLTNDINIFSTFLENASYNSLTKQGTDFYSAISLAISRFQTSEIKSKYIVILSDGGDDNIDLSKIKKLDIKGLGVFVIGIGTEVGAMIPDGIDIYNKIIYKKYQGEYVISKLNKDLLKKLAGALGGTYFDLENTKNIISDIDKLNKNIVNKQKTAIINSNKSLIFIYLSFILFLFYLFSYIFPGKQN